MKILSLNVSKYKIPFKFPLTVNNRILTSREGLVVQLMNSNGVTGFGEIAPFPGLHKENLDKVFAELHQLWPYLNKTIADKSFYKINGEFEKWLGSGNLSPSTKFGIELALLNLVAASEKKPLYALLSESYTPYIKLNGLLAGSPASVYTQAKRLVEQGYQTLKIKVGRQPIKNDIRMIQNLRNIIGEDIDIRLDANRAWSLEDAIIFGNAVAECKIEYIEEPLKAPEEVSKFYGKTAMPVALDETLADIPLSKYVPEECIKAFVLKPSILGGIEKTVKICRRAEDNGIVPVISSTFDSGITLTALAQIAAIYTSPDTAMGLDTYKWLKEDLLDIPFKAEGGKVDIEEAGRMGQNIRADLLNLETQFNK